MEEILSLSLRPLEGKLKWVAKPSWLEVMPSQRQQLLEVQFKEGEEGEGEGQERSSFCLVACMNMCGGEE